MDQRIDKQKEAAAKDHWMISLVRTDYMNKNTVYKAFHDAVGR